MKKMKIRYEEPLDKENIGLLATIAIIIFGGLLFMNFYSSSGNAVEIALSNLVFIPALLLMIVLIGVGYFNHLSNKKSLEQIISEYHSFSKHPFYDEPFKGFYLNDKQVTICNYEPLRKMPKNIASYFAEEKK